MADWEVMQWGVCGWIGWTLVVELLERCEKTGKGLRRDEIGRFSN
jgi:hypothetical protein